jgi:hypothetical protein
MCRELKTQMSCNFAMIRTLMSVGGKARSPANKNIFLSSSTPLEQIAVALTAIWFWRLTKPKHHRTNGQVERKKRTIKDANGNRFQYDGPAPQPSRRQTARHLKMPYALRIHLQHLDKRSRKSRADSAPSRARTKHQLSAIFPIYTNAGPEPADPQTEIRMRLDWLKRPSAADQQTSGSTVGIVAGRSCAAR